MKFWWQQSLTWRARLLIPLAYLYFIVIKLRRFLYRLGIIKSKAYAIPVVVVGNISVCGTGKTPLVIALAKLLVEHGYNPGIVSRGYKGQSKQYPILVTKDSNPKIVGDESILLAKHSNCPVVIAPKRLQAIDYLLEKFDCNIVLADDGLQHYAMQRDLEIALVDGQRQLGNAQCLPAGPLREPKSRLRKVDFVLVKGEQFISNAYNMLLQPIEFVNVKDPSKIAGLQQFSQQLVHAVAGIGNPRAFFSTLAQLGLVFTENVFIDHHPYEHADFKKFNLKQTILMTEKDAVKCVAFATSNMWFLKVKADMPVEFVNKFLNKLSNIAYE